MANKDLVDRILLRLSAAHGSDGSGMLYFVVLPTEIHSIAHTVDGKSPKSISRSFSHVVSRWVREAQALRGPVLIGPCHAEPIESEEALRSEIRMLAWRPVRRKLCITATYYPHAALRIALGLKAGRWFDASPLREVFSESKSQARADIRSLIEKAPTDEEWRAWELIRRLEIPAAQVGSQPAKALSRPVGAGAAALIAAGGSFGIEGALRLLEAWVSARIHPAGRFDLHKGSGTLTVRGRALVACLAVHHRICSAATVARHFSRAKATLSEQMAKCRGRPVDRAILATPLQRILDESVDLRPVMKSTRTTEANGM